MYSSRRNEADQCHWFDTTLESIADAVIATDKFGAIAAMNAAAERLTGWARDHAQGRFIQEVMVVRLRSGERLECPVLQLLRGEVLRSDDALPDDATLVRRDGTTVPIADSVSLIRDPAGAVLGAVMVFRDVTTKARELERLSLLARASVELNASLDYDVTIATFARIAVPTIADGCVVVVTNDGGLVALATAHVDPVQAERMRAHFATCRHRSQSFIEDDQPELIPEVGEAFLERFEPACREVIRDLDVASYVRVPLERRGERMGEVILLSSERRLDTSDLNVAIALAEHAAISVDHARLFEMLCVARAEADVRRSEAEQANRSKDDFLAVLGHELRNPLAPMTTALDLMKLRSSDSLERGILERQVKHMTRLVDDLLDISRITSGKLILTKKRLDFAEVVANGIDLVGPLLGRKDHELIVSIAPDLWVDGDPVRLAQVISNLLGNAAKYSDAGAAIRIDVDERDGEVVLVMRDHGIGIDASILPRVFEPFVQQPQGINRADGGLGLGLAIVQGIVHAHGGSVTANSDGLGYGTAIEVRLPAAARISEPRPLVPPAALPYARVLVVDDNEDALVLVVELLRRLNYEVVSAKDPGRALELARTNPEIAFLDIGLPGMDGYELGRRLRELDGSRRLKLVALTGYGRECDHARSRAAGFDLHLVKPVTLETLQATLDRFKGDRLAHDAS